MLFVNFTGSLLLKPLRAFWYSSTSESAQGPRLLLELCNLTSVPTEGSQWRGLVLGMLLLVTSSMLSLWGEEKIRLEVSEITRFYGEQVCSGEKVRVSEIWVWEGERENVWKVYHGLSTICIFFSLLKHHSCFLMPIQHTLQMPLQQEWDWQ